MRLVRLRLGLKFTSVQASTHGQFSQLSEQEHGAVKRPRLTPATLGCTVVLVVSAVYMISYAAWFVETWAICA